MQTKGLFAALLCGTICLTGCLENIESESVAEVRKAKAEELISVANLNNAQAAAETIKAKAQATIAEAQAQLLEAQAAIAQAEALRLTIQAELDAVNVEIAKVKLESEKVKLQEQKAKLEQTLAEVEAAIAKANLAKETALIMLAKAQKQAEIDQIKMQKNLVEAEQEMLKQAQKMDEEAAKAVKAAWRNYSDAMEKYYAAVADLMKTEAQIATMQNNMTAGLSIMSAKVQGLEQHLEKLNAEIEYLRSFEVVPPDKYDIIHADALKGLEAAYTNKQVAEDNLELIEALYDAKKEMFTPEADEDQLAYISHWQENLIGPMKSQLAALGLEYVASYDENNVPVIGVQFPQTDKLPFFTPLFTGSFKWSYSQRANVVAPFYGVVYEVPTGEYYPQMSDGIISPYAIPVTKAEFTPAKIYDNYIAVLLTLMELKAYADASLEKDEWEEAYNKVINGQINKIEPNIEPGKPEYDGYTPGLQETIDTYQAIYDAMKKYVDTANAVLDPAYAQIAIAERNYQAAQEEYRASVVALVAYNLGQTDFAKYNEAQLVTREAKADVKAAAKKVRRIGREIHNLREALNGEIDDDYEMPEPDDPDFGPEYGGFISDEGLLTRQAVIHAAVEAQEIVVAEAERELAPLQEALTTAENNLKTQIEEVIPAKYEAEREAWNEYQAAFAAWVINPNEDTEAIKDAKEAAYYGTDTQEGALPELKKAIAQTKKAEPGEDKTLKDLFDEAKEAFDPVNEDYKEKAEFLEYAKQYMEVLDAQVQETQAELAEAEQGLILAKEALVFAKERLAEAKAAEEIAYDKIKWIENPSYDNIPEEEIALIENVIAAMKGASDAEKALDKDWDTYLALYEAYNYGFGVPGEDEVIFNKYEEYTNQLDPNYAKLSRRDRPSQKDEWGWHEPVYSYSGGKEPSIAQKLNNAKKHLQTVNETYNAEIKAIDDALAYSTEERTNIMDAVLKYASVEENYLTFGANIETSYNGVMSVREKVIDADMAVDLAEAKMEGVHYVATRVVFVGVVEKPGSEPETKECTMADIEEIVRFIQTGKYFDEEEQKIKDVDPKEFLCINKCKEKIAQLNEAMAMYFVDREVNAKELNELKAEYESLKKKIEVYNALVELYSSRIALFTASNPE